MKQKKYGISKSKKVAENSDLIIAMFDNSKPLNKEDKEILKILKNKNAIIILNKIDLKESNLEHCKEIKDLNKKIIKTSLITKFNINEIYEELNKIFKLQEIASDNEVIITNVRHKELILESLKCVQEAKEALKQGMPIDIISINIKEILQTLGKITGDNVSEDVIKEIFSKFCLGK